MNKLKSFLKSNFTICILGLGLYVAITIAYDLVSIISLANKTAEFIARGVDVSGMFLTTWLPNIILYVIHAIIPLALVITSVIVYKNYLVIKDKNVRVAKHKFVTIFILLLIAELIASVWSVMLPLLGITNLNNPRFRDHYTNTIDPGIFRSSITNISFGIVCLIVVIISIVYFVLFALEEKKTLFVKEKKAQKSETEMLLSDPELKESLIKGKTMSSEDTIKEEDLAYRVEYTIEAKNDIEILRKKGLLNSFNSILDKMKNETFLNPKKSNVLDNELTGLFTQKINHQYKFAYMVFEDERIIRIVRILPTKK